MKKTKFDDGSQIKLIKETVYLQLQRKYRTLFCNIFKFEGFDYDVPRYIMNKLFDGIGLASIKLATNSEVTVAGFVPFVENGYNLYGRPIKIRPINEFNSTLVTTEDLLNGTQTTIIKPDLQYSEIVATYVTKLVDIEMTQRTNLKLQKIPFAVTNPAMQDAINDVLADKETVAVSDTIADTTKAIQTNAPFILDKLQNYKIDIENELLNILGIKSVKHEKAAQMNVDETNMAEQESACYQDILFDKLTAWLNETNRLFGTNFKVSLNELQQEVSKEKTDESV